MFATVYSTKGTRKKMFNNEVGRLVLMGFLKNPNDSECGSPYLPQPKPKTNQVHFLSNFINLNNKLKRKPYPLPKINEILLKSEGFQYAMSLDLNIVYYNIQIISNSRNFFLIILPLGKYRYKRLPMGIYNSPDIFQHKKIFIPWI